jgi:hypothetical protein
MENILLTLNSPAGDTNANKNQKQNGKSIKLKSPVKQG